MFLDYFLTKNAFGFLISFKIEQNVNENFEPNLDIKNQLT